MNSKDLREKFLNFFEKKGHKIVRSTSLIPENDQTVLFTTAGMQQFKGYYLNPESAPYATAASIQKCLRTSDIEEVGDKTHLTFFEMLGNFSFGYPDKKGSYFKKEAIEYAWEFLTEVLEIEKERISATYFKGEKGISEDEESLEILKKINGLLETKIKPQGFDDNFWSLGTERSPGGPTVEFYVDGVEIWNIVFNEYIYKNGKYEELKYKGVDTGMGLERLLVVLNDYEDNYHCDTIWPIIEKIEEISGKKYKDNKREFRIIADHARAATFILGDNFGIAPSNLDRGYVLRRLIRMAIRIGKKININKIFTAEVANIIIDEMSSIYLELGKNKDFIIKQLNLEEEKFARTLKKGLNILNKEIETLGIFGLGKYGVARYGKTKFSGKIAFDLYQTYGFPKEMIQEELRGINDKIQIDEDEYQREFKKHQEVSRKGAEKKFKGGLADASEETTKLHTATHLLQAALRKVLGDKIFQKGSNITAERLRFDFSYDQKMTSEQIKEVENLVNKWIDQKIDVKCEEMSYKEAKKKGAVGLFEDKYGEKVKVYSIGDISIEMCGGPHVKNTKELGKFKIKKEQASSKGVRRIKAVLE